MRCQSSLFVFATFAILVPPASAQVIQPYSGDQSLEVNIAAAGAAAVAGAPPQFVAPAGGMTATLDAFANCPPPASKSLLMPGTQHSVTGAGHVVLQLAQALAPGAPVCVVETFTGAGAPAQIAVSEVTENAADRAAAPAPPPAKPVIVPVAAGDGIVLVNPVPPPAGSTATINIYASCPPPAAANALNAPGIVNAVDGSGNEVVVKLASTAKEKEALCAEETFTGGAAPVPPVGSDVITVSAAPAAAPPANSPSSKSQLPNVLAAGGVVVSAGASTNAGSNFNLDVFFDQPISPASRKNPNPLPIDGWASFSGYVRLASIAQPGQVSASSTLTSYVSPAIDSAPANLVQSGELLLAFDLGHKISNTDPARPYLIPSFTLTAGAITPLSSAPSSPTIYIVSQAIYNYYTSASSVSPAAQAAITTACGTSYSSTTPCYVAFLPQDRTRFFRDWSGGFKLKNYYYDASSDAFGFPGITTITFGQNEYVTGGAMSGFVAHVGTVQPVIGPVAKSFAGYLYVFGSMDMVVARNLASRNAPQFSLSTAPSSVTAGQSDVAQIQVAQPNRDRYQFGVELDLVKLISVLKPSTPPAPPTPQ